MRAHRVQELVVFREIIHIRPEEQRPARDRLLALAEEKVEALLSGRAPVDLDLKGTRDNPRHDPVKCHPAATADAGAWVPQRRCSSPTTMMHAPRASKARARSAFSDYRLTAEARQRIALCTASPVDGLSDDTFGPPEK
jgi:hypothetical protein